ncbi:hypothetical protein A3C28_02395 [Candidatus Roizmanbacteria bacterium RIFCSPHIGHO2_02_FULL_39_9]|uniref:Uncharacterized protein n=1 Tax=Candidatus Roizmanbacteria bacterium RIFCSPHIGHO2_02_FULL_39_9 TaxID=1802040 RepID=A0A1F7H8K2_9BACT|nr:MAG: hypothetical protein A3C28_02395 [Candidatus Roizmanbacteria bacterium RIFCSPHIGHO2_02_FULL_39_9]
MPSITDLIIRLQPYSRGLKEFIKKHQDFAEALKVNNPNRFVSVGGIVISFSPLVPKDKIIGFYVYDNKEEKFKQDIIVDVMGEDKEFVVYTRYKIKSSCVKDINEFEQKYGKGIYYKGFHWPKFEEIPEALKPNARIALQLAKLKNLEPKNLTEAEIEKFDRELTELGV